MKSTKILIIACAVIYSALFSLLGISIYQYTKENSAKAAIEYQQIDLENADLENTRETVDIVFNPVKIIQPISLYTNINEIINNEYDSKKLADKIIDWAKVYGINANIACLLVHVESEFKENAQNKNSDATGLCQITDVCLDEFNRKNHKKYTMNDMLIADKNLEVGFWYFARLLDDDIYGKQCDIYTMKDAYIAYNCGPNYFRKHKSELYNGTYRGFAYNAGNRWDSLADMWT